MRGVALHSEGAASVREKRMESTCAETLLLLPALLTAILHQSGIGVIA